MEKNQALLVTLKEMNAQEILEMVAYAKTGNEDAFKAISELTVKEVKDGLEWFIEVLTTA